MTETNLGRVAIVPKGTYSASVQYAVLDAILYEGSTYLVHTTPTIGTLPTNQSYFYLMVQGLSDAIIGSISGSPKGVYANIAALQAALPTGATGVYVVQDTGHWYFWNGTVWTDGGAYLVNTTIVQTIGASTTEIMSQKAVTDELNFLINRANNLYKVTNRTNGKYVRISDGQAISNAAFAYFRVDLTAGAYYCMENDLALTSQDGAYFDANNNFVSELAWYQGIIITNDKKRAILKAPPTAAYALINIVVAQEATTPIFVYSAPSQVETSQTNLNQITKTDDLFVRYPLTPRHRAFLDGYINTEGALILSSSFGCIPPLAVKENDTIRVSNYLGSYSPDGLSQRGIYLDADFKFLSAIPYVNSTTPEYTAPVGAKYVMINFIATDAANINISIEPNITTSIKLRKECIYPALTDFSSGYESKKLVSFGDSITFRNLWQPYLISEFGLIHTNLGIGSTCMINTASTPMCSAARIQAIKDANPDVVTILAGANDLVYSEGGTSAVQGAGIGDATELPKALLSKNLLKFYGAYSYVIESLLSWKPTLRIIILGTTYAHNDGVAYNTLITYTDFSNASKAIAAYYGLPFIDLHSTVGFNKFTMSNAPYNIYSADNIHPNEAGSKRMAEIIIGVMRQINPL